MWHDQRICPNQPCGYNDIKTEHLQEYVLIDRISTHNMYNPSIPNHAAVPCIHTWGCDQGTIRLFHPHQHSHQPQPLLQRTREFFEQKELLGENQKSAEFHFVFNIVYEDFGFYPAKPYPTELQLWWLMQYLDQFFFSGLLTGGQDPTVSLEFKEDIFEENRTLGEDDRFFLGKTQGRMEGSTCKITIQIEAHSDWRREGHFVRRGMMNVLETLVHEMAHAYFMFCTCRCKCCQWQMGANGHGPAWQELKKAMYTTIRQWDLSLCNLYVDDWDDLDYVQQN